MDDLLKISDLEKREIEDILDQAEELKIKQKQGDAHQILAGRSLGLIFAKSSTRTRVSFETGIYQLGGQGIFLSSSDIQLGRGESLADTAKTLSRYLAGIMIRTFEQREVEELALYSSIPVINGLTDKYHPCQALSDLFTIQEKKENLSDLKLAYIGDGNNMAHSLLLAAGKVGMDIYIASPKDYAPDQEVVKKAEKVALNNNSEIKVGNNPKEAVQGADVVYTDVWASMGQEDEASVRKEAFASFQVDKELMSKADKKAIFMHCLPAHRGEEVTAEIIDGSQSVVFDQAENRLHVQKAIMAKLMA